jgi:hypothetical protein
MKKLSVPMFTALALSCALCAPTVAQAAAITVSGTLSAADPTFNRPLSFSQGGSCTLSAVGTAVHYNVFSFTLFGGPSSLTMSFVNADGAAVTPTQADTFLALYGAAGFDPLAPCTNAIAANDDAVGTRSRITINNATGTYFGVVTSFSNVPQAPGNLPWNWTVALNAPNASFQAPTASVPVPGSLALALMGLGLLATAQTSRRRG